MNRIMGIVYFMSFVALFSWLAGQPEHPPREWNNNWVGVLAQSLMFSAASWNACKAIWPDKGEGEK